MLYDGSTAPRDALNAGVGGEHLADFSLLLAVGVSPVAATVLGAGR